MDKNNFISSINSYDLLAKDYAEISSKKQLYINAVNNLIIENAPESIINYLDAGCGDGLRTKDLIDKLKPDKAVLIDNSPKMISLVKKESIGEAYLSSIADFNYSLKFDLITSLWNVFGHIENEKRRIESLKNLRKCLSDDGILILDVNNRYNIDYGLISVLKNIIIDLNLFKKNRKKGWFSFRHNGKKFSTYLHNFFEISQVLRKAGYQIIKYYSVGYNTGVITQKSIFKGQLLLIVKKYGQKK